MLWFVWNFPRVAHHFINTSQMITLAKLNPLVRAPVPTCIRHSTSQGACISICLCVHLSIHPSEYLSLALISMPNIGKECHGHPIEYYLTSLKFKLSHY